MQEGVKLCVPGRQKRNLKIMDLIIFVIEKNQCVLPV